MHRNQDQGRWRGGGKSCTAIKSHGGGWTGEVLACAVLLPMSLPWLLLLRRASD